METQQQGGCGLYHCIDFKRLAFNKKFCYTVFYGRMDCCQEVKHLLHTVPNIIPIPQQNIFKPP